MGTRRKHNNDPRQGRQRHPHGPRAWHSVAAPGAPLWNEHQPTALAVGYWFPPLPRLRTAKLKLRRCPVAVAHQDRAGESFAADIMRFVHGEIASNGDRPHPTVPPALPLALMRKYPKAPVNWHGSTCCARPSENCYVRRQNARHPAFLVHVFPAIPSMWQLRSAWRRDVR